jgi:predicted GTPase
MDNTEIDAQCRKMLQGASELERILANTSYSNILSISDDAKSASNYTLLLRIRHSLNEYTERGKDLLYIGLMGHFSAGKSSTINSLIGSTRVVNLHPTDKDITLITHKENKASVIISTRESLVPIRADTEHESHFLRNIVLADTPGTGDPLLIKEIAKEFLPICDLLLYFFSATNPLDNADVPLLKEKNYQLEFIPIKFIITRADEFRIDANKVLSQGNFNNEKAREFISELIIRINKIMDGVIFNNNDFYIIDNKEGFNITKLREYLEETADPKNIQHRIMIHSHKILYFLNILYDVKRYYCDYLRDKIIIISELVKTAQDNIDKYHNNIMITNNRMTESWQKYSQQLNRRKQDIMEEVEKYELLPKSLYDIAMNNERMNKFVSTIDKQTEYQWINIQNRTRSIIIDQMAIVGAQMKTDIAKEEFKEITPINFQRNKYIPNDVPEEYYYLPDSVITDEAIKQFSVANSQLLQQTRNIDDYLVELSKQLFNQKPLHDIENIHNNAKNDLDNDLNNFFNNITIYRSGVFSLRAKEAITKLGIGKELDKLENDDISDSEKENIKKDAIEIFFPKLNIFSESYVPKLELMYKECKIISNKLQLVKEKKISTIKNIDRESVESEVSTLKAFLQSTINEQIKYFVDKIIDNCEIKITELITNYKADIELLQKERKRKILSWVFLMGLIPIAILLGYNYINKINIVNTIGQQLIIGIAGNLIGDLIGIIIGRTLNNVPKIITLKKSEIRKLLRANYDLIIDDNISSLKTEKIEIPKVKIMVREIWHKYLLDVPYKTWLVEALPLYSSLEKLQIELISLKDNYLSIIDQMINQSQLYFNDIEKNLDKLSEIAEPIKNRVIQPEFNLLARTNSALDSLKKEIENIVFT